MEKSTRYTFILLAILAALLLFLPQNQGPHLIDNFSPPPAASLSASPNPPRENQTIELSLSLPPQCTYSDGALKVDNRSLASVKADENAITASLRLSSGSHFISYDDGKTCSAALALTVLPSLCKEGASKACANSRGCAGTQKCAGGVWLACRTPTPICSPNTKVPCPIDSCRWGMTTCNSCGSAWSICK